MSKRKAEKVVEFKYASPKLKVLYPSMREPGKKYVAIKGGRSSGKSWGVALFLIDVARTYDNMFIVCAREVMKSIKDSSKKLLEDTVRRLGIADEFTFYRDTIKCNKTGSFFSFIGFTGNIEAFKGTEGIDILWVDEAASLSDETMTVIGPTVRKAGSQVIFTWNPVLPTTPVEAFLRVHEKASVVVHINYTENAYCSKSTLDEAAADMEADIDRYNWIWLGHYRAQGSDTFIPLGLVTGACERPYVMGDDGVVAGLDVGLFHDRCVLVIRQGNNVLETCEYKGVDPDEVVEKVCGVVTKYRVQRLGIDANGQGAAIFLSLRKQLGELIVGVMPGAAARDKKRYSKVRDESWGRVREWLPTAHLPRNRQSEWVTDLTNMKFFYDDQGRYKLESKKSYLGRGFKSPDYGDALAYSLLMSPDTSSRDWLGGGSASEEESYAREPRRDRLGCGWMGV